MATTTTDTKSYANFLSAIRDRESTQNYQHVSKKGYLGAYQFAEVTLKDLGYYKDNTKAQDWVGTFTGKDGVTSKTQLLNTPALQDKVFDNMLKLYWKYANQDNYHMTDHIGETIKGILITPSVIVAGSHLAGIGDMRDFLDTKGGNADANALVGYLKGLSGFKLPFVSGSSGGSDDPSGPAPDDGSKAEIFVFKTVSQADRGSIQNFQDGDKIDLSAIDAKSYRSGNQAFKFNGDKETSKGGRIFYDEDLDHGVTYVHGNTGNAHFDIKIKGVGLHLSAADFIL